MRQENEAWIRKIQVRDFLENCSEHILSRPGSRSNQQHSILGKGKVTHEAVITLTYTTKGVKSSNFPVRNSYLKNKRQLEALGSRSPLELYAAKNKLTPLCVFFLLGSQPHVVGCLVFSALNSSIRIFQISE